MDEARERFDESLDIIRKAWTQERLSYNGRFHTFDDVEIVPKPFQQPHPRLWQPTVSPQSYHDVAERGMNAFIGPYFFPREEHQKDFARWYEALDAVGRPHRGSCGYQNMIYVAETREKALEESAQAARWCIDNTYLPAKGQALPSQYELYDGIGDTVKDLSTKDIQEKCFLCGSPDDITSMLKELEQSCGFDAILPIFDFGGPPHEKVMNSLRLFAEYVIPEIR